MKHTRHSTNSILIGTDYMLQVIGMLNSFKYKVSKFALQDNNHLLDKQFHNCYSTKINYLDN